MAFGGTIHRQHYNAKEKWIPQVETDLINFYQVTLYDHTENVI